MRRAELREVVAGHLAAKGYSAEMFAWHPRFAVCDVLVGADKLVPLRISTRTSKAARAKEFARIPRRGPPRKMARMHGDKADRWRQTDIEEFMGESRR